MVWVSWKNLCRPKVKGGMGFRDLKAFNLALLAKQGRRIQQNPNSLIHRVLKAKYFAKSSFMDAQVGRNPSYIWRSIVAARPVIKEGPSGLLVMVEVLKFGRRNVSLPRSQAK